ncbi:MAG TPA: peptidylprolyl isomerase [Gemmataceae bacterium]|jgi:parvulin-like peptidyl-prolyl isomerase
MPARKKVQPTRRGWRGIAILGGCLVLIAGAGYWIRSSLLPRADAQTPIPAAKPTVAPDIAAQPPSDYSRRVVAYLFDNEPVTREQFGEYLIERHADKLELLINKRIIDDACRQYNIEVTGGEIESALAEQLQGIAVDQNTFVNTILARYHKNINEWKEDVIRSRLLMSKLCRSRVHVSDEELQKAFEAGYGEKVECQIILWPKTKEGKEQAIAEYASIRDNVEAFDRMAKAQTVKPQLAATAGRVRPFGRYVMGDENFDRIVFRLKPNEVSEVFETIDGPVVVKCLRRIPADTTIRLESVRDKLTKEVEERKIPGKMQTAFDTLKHQANPQKYLQKKSKAEDSDGLQPCEPSQRYHQVIAVYNGQTPITREDFGEFLIGRYGADQIEFLINRLIIDKACQARSISVTPEEIEASLNDDLKKMGSIDLKVFEKDFLGPYNKNIYEWREDVVRPRLLMAKLCRDGVKVTDQDLQQSFEAEYGEKLEGRMILWPSDQTRYAMTQYTRIRDNPEAFDEMARHQASSTLAAKGGKIGPFGRASLGNKDVEEEAFKLHSGEMTTLLETPEGNVVFKLDKRYPPNKSVTLDSVRERLTRDVFEQKVQREMQTAFQDMREKARPKVMLKDTHKPEDIAATTKKLLSNATDKPNTEAAHR